VAELELEDSPSSITNDSVDVREIRLLNDAPWVRSGANLLFPITVTGWKFPGAFLESQKPVTPLLQLATEELPKLEREPVSPDLPDQSKAPKKPHVRPRPTRETVHVKDRLLYLLQPPLDSLFEGKQIQVPFQPFPYQLEGIAFLMPRHSALLADEMGLGKTAQTILATRLLFHSGMIERALIVCPKPLVANWSRELKLWAPDLPFEVCTGDGADRRSTWLTSNCPLKLVNYEVLTRDAEIANSPEVKFDLVILDEAQRIKNHESKTAQVVRALNRSRSWALSGTPIENRPEDLVNIFSFIDPGRIPTGAPISRLGELTSDSILRRVKEDVQSDMPPKFIRDLPIELTDAQRNAYDRAEKDGVVHLNELGETITVQHVFQLVMRLKQICNFDPLTGASAKLEQLKADLEEVVANDRKAIIFSQWVEPLEILAKVLAPFGVMEYHGKIPSPKRQPILDQFKEDPTKHVILMSYGTGSVGLNLQFTNHVFLFDRWWNPAIEDQAINRAHRIGQKHPVNVTRFVVTDSIEQRIASVLEGKRKLFEQLLARKEPPPVLGLTEDEIFGLFNIRPKSKAKAA
jgi:SNF2 family DNA or RNA helicase